MACFKIQEILTVTSGQLIGYSDESTSQILLKGISTDSRNLNASDVFIALVGAKYDAHEYCQDVYDSGTHFFVLSDASCLPTGATGFLVKDTLVALQSLANYYRKKMNCTVIGITGSVGKTSTRQMLETAFSSVSKTYATKENNNNEIGMPLTILSAPEDTEILILEMGMRLKGEIRLLTNIAQPDIAIVTNIGVSHIERLGSRQDILEAKMEICEGLGAQGLLIINYDDPMLRNYVHHASNRTWCSLGSISFATCKDLDELSDCLIHVDQVELFPEKTCFCGCIYLEHKKHKFKCNLNVVGVHHVKNALFAILCVAALKKDLNIVLKALEEYYPVGSRGKVIQTNRYTIYDDAYNASPESMAAAFESAKQIAKGRRMVAALGGILELGEYAAQIHEQVGQNAAKTGFDKVFVCGDYKSDFKKGYLSVSEKADIFLFDNKDDLLKSLLSEIRRDDVIVIKASNSFGFQAFAEEIIHKEQCSVND